eukprot:8980549-Pyramimonas_sp.AAC.2
MSSFACRLSLRYFSAASTLRCVNNGRRPLARRSCCRRPRRAHAAADSNPPTLCGSLGARCTFRSTYACL